MEYVRGPDLQVRVARARAGSTPMRPCGSAATSPARSARRPPARHPPPRREAAEHPARPRRPRAAHRLRLRQARRPARRHRQRHARGHAGLHRARGARRPPRRRAGRPLRARAHALLRAHRRAARARRRRTCRRRPTPTGFRPARRGPGVPGWLDDVVARATCAAAEDRFPTAAALDEALARPGAADALRAPAPAPRCLLCGGPDPLALGLCPACGGSGDAADTLVFLRRVARTHRRAAPRRCGSSWCCPMSAATPRARPRGGAAAVPRLARRRAAACWRRWSGASCRPARCRSARAWGACRRKAWMLAGAAVTAGAVAGTVALPMLLWTSPLVGHARAARRRAATRARRWWRRPARRRAAARARAQGGGGARELPAGTAREPPGRRRARRAARCSPRSTAPATSAGWRPRSASWSRPPAAPPATSPTWTRSSAGSSASASASRRRARAARRAGPLRAHPRRAGAAAARGDDRGGAAPDPARRAGEESEPTLADLTRELQAEADAQAAAARRSRRCSGVLSRCRPPATRTGPSPDAAQPPARGSRHTLQPHASTASLAPSAHTRPATPGHAPQAGLCLAPPQPRSTTDPVHPSPLLTRSGAIHARAAAQLRVSALRQRGRPRHPGAGRGPGRARRHGGRREPAGDRAASEPRLLWDGDADEEGLLTVHRVPCRRARGARRRHPRRGGLSPRRPRRSCASCSRREPYDVVHFVFSLPTAAMLPLLDLRGAPVVVSLRGSDVPGFDAAQVAVRRAHRLLHPLTRWIWRRADRVIVPSESLGRLARRTDPGLALRRGARRRGPRPLPAARGAPPDPGRRGPLPRRGAPGRAERPRRPDRRDRAARARTVSARDRRHRPARGGAPRAGPARWASRRRCASPAGSITPRSRAATARPTCSPWRRGSSRSATRSSRRWRRGCPIVAARPAAFRSWSSTAATGCWCRPRRPRELAHAISYLAADPSSALETGRRNRADAERTYSWDRATTRHLALYHGVRRRLPARPG